MKKLALVFSLLGLSLAACGKSAEAGSGGNKPVAAGATVTLPKVNGLKMDVPAGTTVGDGIVGGHMVQGPDLVVNVDFASDSRPTTIEAATKEAGDYTPKNIKSEKLADGWVLTFDNEGGMGKNYFAQVRRDLGGKATWCETTASSPKQQANAVAACKSMHP